MKPIIKYRMYEVYTKAYKAMEQTIEKLVHNSEVYDARAPYDDRDIPPLYIPNQALVSEEGMFWYAGYYHAEHNRPMLKVHSLLLELTAKNSKIGRLYWETVDNCIDSVFDEDSIHEGLTEAEITAKTKQRIQETEEPLFEYTSHLY